MGSPEKRIRAAELAGTIAKVGIDPTLKERALQDALISAIADRRGDVDWTVDDAGWIVRPIFQEERTFCGRILSEGLACCRRGAGSARSPSDA